MGRRSYVRTIVGLACLLWAAASAAEPPRVRLVATGGTISNRPGERLTAEELVDLVPDLETYATVEAEQFSNVSSSSISLDDWLRLARRINTLFAEQRDLAGIVVTSGTDTLEETAFFLHLTVLDERPVVVVGAMRNPSQLGYDGAANLQQAVRVAAEPASRGQGVLVVLNGQIDSARDVTKTDTHSLHTFTAKDRGILGLVDRDRIVYYHRLLSRHTASSEFDLTGVDTLPRVDIIMVYQGASGDLIQSAVRSGARGVIVASAGAGATSGTQREALAEVADAGVTVVIASRTGGGRIPPPSQEGAPSSDARRYPRIAAQDLTPLKSRILLMLALTRTDRLDEIQRMFNEY